MGSKALWVFTDSGNEIAQSFYISIGFELLGPARDWAPSSTLDRSDLVLKRTLRDK